MSPRNYRPVKVHSFFSHMASAACAGLMGCLFAGAGLADEADRQGSDNRVARGFEMPDPDQWRPSPGNTSVRRMWSDLSKRLHRLGSWRRPAMIPRCRVTVAARLSTTPAPNAARETWPGSTGGMTGGPCHGSWTAGSCRHHATI